MRAQLVHDKDGTMLLSNSREASCAMVSPTGMDAGARALVVVGPIPNLGRSRFSRGNLRRELVGFGDSR